MTKKRAPGGPVPGWLLKIGSTFVAGLIFWSSLNYAAAHPWNPSAPLQPARDAAAATPAPTTAPAFGRTGRFPTTNFQPGVTTTTRTPVTRSHSS